MPETINVTVEEVRFHKPETGFTVLSCVHEQSHQELKVVGNFPPVEEGELIAVTGEWRNSRWGRQFFAEALVPIVPTSLEGVQSYLAAGHVTGIGKKLATRLLEHFGADLLRIIDEEPQRLLEVRGVGKVTLQDITNSWARQRGVRDVMLFLSAHGLSGARAFHVQKHYGNGVVNVIRENPYRLAEEVRGIGFD